MLDKLLTEWLSAFNVVQVCTYWGEVKKDSIIYLWNWWKKGEFVINGYYLNDSASVRVFLSTTLISSVSRRTI